MTLAKDELIDYYEVLQCNRDATYEDLKKSFQCLALAKHPDKSNGRSCDFTLIQEAWSILRDPESRRKYDSELLCQENSECLLFDTIYLNDMEYDSDNSYYSYSCRCGGRYLLDNIELSKDIIIPCDECSFSIKVLVPDNV